MRAADILINAHTSTDADTELVYGFDSSDSIPRLDAIRYRDHVLTMADADMIGGDAGDEGFAFTWGRMIADEHGETYEDESDAQWADTADEAEQRVARWLERVTAG